MPFTPLTAFKRQRLARAVVGIIVLAGAALAQYELAHVAGAVDVATIKELSPATTGEGEELIIESPMINAAEGTLFSHSGKTNEIVDAIFDQARLDAATVAMFESYGFGLKPPATPARIYYQAQESPPSTDAPCHTQVDLRTSSQMPAEIRFSQFDDPGSKRDRYLQMTVKGAELTANLLTDSESDSDRGPGCQKLLKVGDWKQPLASGSLTIVVGQDAPVRFYFRPRTADENLWAQTQGSLPLTLGARKQDSTDPPFQARAVSISSRGRDGSTSVRASARSADDGLPLNINGLSIASDQIQVSIAGKGFVKVNGKPATINFLKPIQENPVLLAILVAVNGALLAWVARQVFKTPHTPRGSKD
jgi:hypothetical protein